MLPLLEHIFAFAETYAVLLVWICVPLGFYAAYLIMKDQFGMFDASQDMESVEVPRGDA